jgi:hypothetical protein
MWGFSFSLRSEKSFFFRFVRMQAKHSKQRKKSEMSQKRKGKRKITIPVKVGRSLYKYFLTTGPQKVQKVSQESAKLLVSNPYSLFPAETFFQ